MQVRNAFTLIELAVVMTIMSLMAVAISFRMLGPWQAATIQNDLEKIRSIDQMARRTATSEGIVVQLVFDTEASIIIARNFDDEQELRRCKLSAHCSLADVLVGGSGNVGQSILTISGAGASRSYAIRINTESKVRWLLCVGQTGQFLDNSGKSDVEEFLSAMAQMP